MEPTAFLRNNFTVKSSVLCTALAKVNYPQWNKWWNIWVLFKADWDYVHLNRARKTVKPANVDFLWQTSALTYWSRGEVDTSVRGLWASCSTNERRSGPVFSLVVLLLMLQYEAGCLLSNSTVSEAFCTNCQPPRLRRWRQRYHMTPTSLLLAENSHRLN